jgi:hypothetical protein
VAAESAGEAFGALVGFDVHLAVTNFESRDIRGEPGEILLAAITGQAGEHMVYAKEQSTFGEVHQERDKIAATALNFGMIAFADAVNTKVHFGAGGHAHGNFFAKKEIGIFAKGFRAFDGIVVGQGNDGHAVLLAAEVDVLRFVVGLPAKPG